MKINGTNRNKINAKNSNCNQMALERGWTEPKECNEE